MKTNNLYKLALLTPIIAFAVSCNSNKKQIEVQKKVYKMAMEANDYSSALVAAYQVINLEHKSTYLDSIANLYFEIGNYIGAEKIASEVLKNNASKEMKAIVAKSQKNSGKYSDAILNFQQLMTEDPENALEYEYNIGECNFFLKNYQGCLEYMKKVTDREQSKQKTIELVFNNQRHNVPYNLAALNTVAYVLTINGSYDQGITIYEKVLEAKPDFALARNNYQYALQVKKESEKKK